MLVPGGAAEALHAHESNFRLHIKNRKGFIRLALETKAKPIPCLGFGENQVFDTIYARDKAVQTGGGTTITKLMQRVQKCLSFSTPIMRHPFPRRRPIDVVVGKPVESPARRMGVSEAEYVDVCHALYRTVANNGSGSV